MADSTWDQDRNEVKAKLKEHTVLLEKIRDTLVDNAVDIATIKIKIGLIGAIFGIIGGTIGTIIATLLTHQ